MGDVKSKLTPVLCPVLLVVKKKGFQSLNGGSIPPQGTIKISVCCNAQPLNGEALRCLSMRICPECGAKRPTPQIDTVTMHIDDKCFEKLVEKHGGASLSLVKDVGVIYARYGLEHAGPLPNRVKEKK